MLPTELGRRRLEGYGQRQLDERGEGGGTGNHGREGGDVNGGRLKEPMMGKRAVGVYSGIAGADELGGASTFEHEGRAMRGHGCTDNPMRGYREI